MNDGVAHYANLQTCASIHACPVCAPKIRSGRADEIEQAVSRWLNDGHAAYMLTLTVRHDAGDQLAALLDAISDSWKYCIDPVVWKGAWRHGCSKTGRRWGCELRAHDCPRRWYDDGLRDELGVQGFIRALEVTHGANGWHPHLHVLVLVEQALDVAERAALEGHFFDHWGRRIAKHGYGPLVEGVGVHVSQVSSPADIADYVAKFVDDAGASRAVGNELARHDLKNGRRKGRTPWQVLTDAKDHGDARDLDIWTEYEKATFGRRAITWSHGLKDRLRVVEVDDEELAEEKVGGDVIAILDDDEWRTVRTTRGAMAELLSRVEHAGTDGGALVIGHFLVELRAGVWNRWQRPPPLPS